MSDLISRKAALDVINDIRDCVSVDGYWAMVKRLKKLPAAEPKRKIGQWIPSEMDSMFLVCSECKSDSPKLARAWRKEYMKIYRFCPNCGARMEGGNE